MFCLVCLIALTGDNAAKNALRTRAVQIATEPSSYDYIGAQELLIVNDEVGLIELSKIYGKKLLCDPDDFVPDNLLYLIEEKENRYIQILREQSKLDHAIMAYLKYLEKKGYVTIKC